MLLLPRSYVGWNFGVLGKPPRFLPVMLLFLRKCESEQQNTHQIGHMMVMSVPWRFSAQASLLFFPMSTHVGLVVVLAKSLVDDRRSGAILMSMRCLYLYDCKFLQDCVA